MLWARGVDNVVDLTSCKGTLMNSQQGKVNLREQVSKSGNKLAIKAASSGNKVDEDSRDLKQGKTTL